MLELLKEMPGSVAGGTPCSFIAITEYLLPFGPQFLVCQFATQKKTKIKTHRTIILLVVANERKTWSLM